MERGTRMQIKGMWYDFSEVIYENGMRHYDFQDVNMLIGEGFRHVLHIQNGKSVLQVTCTPDFNK
jgi:hypothetical protein